MSHAHRFSPVLAPPTACPMTRSRDELISTQPQISTKPSSVSAERTAPQNPPKKSQVSLARRESGSVRLDDADNDTEKPQSAAENLHDEHLHEHLGALGIRQGAATARGADADAADQVGETDGEADCEPH